MHSKLQRLISNQRQVTSLHSCAVVCKFHQSNKQSCGASGTEFLPRGNFPNMFASLAMHTVVLLCAVGITTKPVYHVNITGEVMQWLMAVNNYRYIYTQNQQTNNYIHGAESSWEATSHKLLKKFAAFCGTKRSVAILTTARHLSPSVARWSQSMSPHTISLRSILILSLHLRLGL